MVWINKQFKIDFKIMKYLCTVQEFGTFCFQFPFFFEISQCTNTANILLCNKMHLKWTYIEFFHVPLQKNINWFPLRGGRLRNGIRRLKKDLPMWKWYNINPFPHSRNHFPMGKSFVFSVTWQFTYIFLPHQFINGAIREWLFLPHGLNFIAFQFCNFLN